MSKFYTRIALSERLSLEVFYLGPQRNLWKSWEPKREEELNRAAAFLAVRIITATWL